MHLHEIVQIYASLYKSVQDCANLFNLRFNLRKIEEGEGVTIKPKVLLEENKGGEGGGLELFSRSANRKNLR